MKNSKLLKLISYILIPILLGIIILSVFYEIAKTNTSQNTELEDKNYFQSNSFLNSYMQILESETSNLIYRNSEYQNVQDGEYFIYYSNNNENAFIYDKTTVSFENMYYLIIYKNKAFTNVELTAETNTLENVKEYISKNSENKKYANIINGIVTSNSEVVENKALQYFDYFKYTYYTRENVNYSLEENLIMESNAEENQISNEYIYVTTSVNDFEIYSSYSEKIIYETNNVLNTFSNKIVKHLEMYDSIIVYSIPICAILLILFILYLIVATGHIAGKEEIDLNDIDKIPLEIILLVCGGIIAFILIGTYSITIDYNFESANFKFIFNCLASLYVVSYILLAVIFNTATKRIKSKTFWNTTIIGKILKFIFKVLKAIFQKIQRFFERIDDNLNITVKIIIMITLYVLISIFFALYVGGMGIIIDFVLLILVLYYVVRVIDEFKRIENRLETMNEGNLLEKLDEKEFLKIYKTLIFYINNVSTGFENALEERIKSEKMKTELITNVSHDIKTPLTSIINYVDFLKKEEFKSQKAKEYLEILDKKSQRLKKLTEDLVEASKASSGNLKLDMKKICLTELIKQSIGEFEDKFQEKKLKIVTSYPNEKIYILADNRYLYRVIENVFSNVSKYALEDSRVYIDIVQEENKVCTIIKNISKDKLNVSAQELMQRFVRGDKSRNTEGSGLGLSISQNLTELQGGKFLVEVDGDLFKVIIEFEIVKDKK